MQKLFRWGRTTKHPALLLVSLKKRRAPNARGKVAAETVVAAAVAVCVVVAAAICFYFMRSALKNAVNVADAGLQTAQTGTCRLGECLTAPKRQTGRQTRQQQQQQQQWRSEQQQQHATKQTAAEAKK